MFTFKKHLIFITSKEIKMSEELYKKSDVKKLRKVRELTPDSFKAYVDFDKQAMAEGALLQKIKRLIAIAVAHTTQCSFALISI